MCIFTSTGACISDFAAASFIFTFTYFTFASVHPLQGHCLTWNVVMHLGLHCLVLCYIINIYFTFASLHPLQGHCLTWNVGMHRNATSSAQSVVPSRYSKIPCSQLFMLLVCYSFLVFIVSKVNYVSVVVKL